jgi:hypothetical protein
MVHHARTTLAWVATLVIGAQAQAGAGAAPAAGAPGAVVHRFVPAYFDPGPASLQKILKCPNLTSDDKVVRVLCKVAISAEGVVETSRSAGTYCPTPFLRTDNYAIAALKAMQAAKFSPARIDGTAVPVYISILALFVHKEGGCQAVAVLNRGVQDDSVGLDFVEPQQVRLGDDWHWLTRVWRHGQLSEPIHWTPPWPRGDVILRISAVVSAEGVASDGRVEGLPAVAAIDARRAAQELQKSRFIPGFWRGVPAAMRVYEFRWYGAAQRLQ